MKIGVKVDITLNMILNNRDKPDIRKKWGLYEVPIATEGSTTRRYIGSTKRSFSDRKVENKRNLKYARKNMVLQN